MGMEDNPFAVSQSSAPPPASPTGGGGGAPGIPPVPGAPAPVGGPGGAAAQQKDALMELLKQMRARAQAHTVLPKGTPQQVPQAGKMSAPPYGGAAAQKQAFLQNIGAVVSGAVAEHKKKDIQKAANDWDAFQNEWEIAQTRAGDPSAPDYQEKVAKAFKEQIDAKHLLDDPKKLKNMAKAFQQDWLNPEKAENTLYKQGINKHLSIQQREDAMKQMKDKMTDRIAQHAGPPKMTPEQQTSRIKAETDLVGKMNDWHAQWEFKGDANGMYAMNKRTGEIKRLHDDETGLPLKAVNKSAKEGVIIKSNGVPIPSTYHNGQRVNQGEPGWTDKDDKSLAMEMAGWTAGENSKRDRLDSYAVVRAKAWAQFNAPYYSVVDTATNSVVMVSRSQMNAAESGRYAPAAQGIQMNNRNAIFKEIDATSNLMNEGIQEMKKEGTQFDADTRAKIAIILRDNKGEMGSVKAAWEGFIASEAAGSLTKGQVKYITALVSMDESGMSLRTVGGMGTGSDTMRAAILRMLPGAGTPSADYAEKQMSNFNVELKALRTSVMKLGNLPASRNKTESGNNIISDPNKVQAP